MLLITPIIIGLLACMPEVAPVGNPERARIDPDISGIWVMEAEDDGVYPVYFEPYDKRTWLVFMLNVEEGQDLDIGEENVETYARFVEILSDKTRGVGDKGFTAEGLSTYKAWTTKLSGELFLTWVSMGHVGEDGSFGMPFALNWHVNKIDADHMILRFIDVSHDRFEGVDKMNRRAFEKVIRKHAKADDLYEDDEYRFVRVHPEHVNLFADLLDLVIDY